MCLRIVEFLTIKTLFKWQYQYSYELCVDIMLAPELTRNNLCTIFIYHFIFFSDISKSYTHIHFTHTHINKFKNIFLGYKIKTFFPLIKLTGYISVCVCVCLYLRISLTTEPIWFPFTVKLLIGPGKIYNHF